MALQPTHQNNGKKSASPTPPPTKQGSSLTGEKSPPKVKPDYDLKINTGNPVDYSKAPKETDPLKVNLMMLHPNEPQGEPIILGEVTPTDDGVQPLSPAGNQTAVTVTCENPTPPTNIVTGQGYPPSSAGVVAGTKGAQGTFAVNTVGTYLPEGSGTETVGAFPGAANDIRVTSGAIKGEAYGSDGVFTSTPNKSHASYPAASTLTSIAPTSSVHGAQVSLTLTGTNFTANSQVFVDGVAAAPLGCGLVSPTSIVLSLTAPSPAGAHSVTVVNDGSAGNSAAQTWTTT